MAGKSLLIIVENLPVPRDRRVWQEATTLAREGWRVSVICPRTASCPKSHEVLEGVHIYRHWLPPEGVGLFGYLVEYSAALLFQFILAWRVLLTRGFDVIQACNPPETIFLVGLFFKLVAGKRFVFDHHDLSPELYVAKFGKTGFMYKLLLAMERWTFRTADFSIATNESFRQVAIKRGGMAPERVHVVRSGPDLSKLKIIPPVPALKRGRRFMVGYMGVMNNQDGVDYLLRAAHHIIREKGRTDVMFFLGGEGPDRVNLERLARELGIEEDVVFTGWLDHAEALPWLNTCDVCVCPDPSNDFNDKCTMNKIVEYMALGKPVVQFDLPEGRVSAGEASLYAHANDPVDLALKILDLLEDTPARERMGAFGRERVEAELSWQRQAPRLIAAYDSLSGDAKGRRRQVPERVSG